MRYTFPIAALCLLTACGDPETPPPQDSDAITDLESLGRANLKLYIKSICRAHFQCPALEIYGLERYSDEASCVTNQLDAYSQASTAQTSARTRITVDLEAAIMCYHSASDALNALPACALESNRIEAALSCPGAFKGTVPEGQRCHTNGECAAESGEIAYCNADELPTCYETSLCVVIRPDPACAACGADTLCVEGACVPLGKAGEPCGEHGCAEGLGCRDITPAGQDTQQTVCAPHGSLKVGERCDSLSARYELCELGLRCVYGQSGERRCAAPIIAQRGEPCPEDDAGRCAPGLVCASDDRCADPLAANAPCNNTNQCAPGLACVRPQDGSPAGTCQPLKAEGATCTGYDECRPGLRCDYIDDTNRRCAPIAPFSCGS